MSPGPRAWLVGTALLAAVGLGACSKEPSFELLRFPGAAASAEPRFTSDSAGAPILSWLEPAGDSTTLRYARLDGAAFGEPHDVVRSDRMMVNWADFPSVTPITDELWFAHWLRKRPEGQAYDVATSISRDGGQNWADAEQMNEDDAETEHGFASVFPWESGIAAVWLDARELANWSFDAPDALLGVSLRLARYDESGAVASREILDSLVCDCCQPDVAMTSAGPIVIYRDRTEEEIRDVVVRRHRADGWTEPVNLGNEGWFIEGCPVNGPVIAAHDEDVVAAWFTAANNMSRVRFARSDDAGASFRAAVDVDVGRVLGQVAIVLDADGRAIVSWWRRGSEGGIDLMLRSFDRDDVAGASLQVAHEAIGQAVDVPQLIAADTDYLVAWTSVADGGSVMLTRVADIP